MKQQSLDFSSNFTSEQLELIEAILQYSLILVYALAGTGKTTTLLAIAKKYSSMKGLYLVFNKANKDEAALKFPKNFMVKGVHGLAYYHLRRAGSKYLNNIRTKDYKESEISKLFGVSQQEAKKAMTVFNKYLNSSLDKISGDKNYHNIAREIYNRMRNCEMEVTHNFYLKEFETLLRNGDIKISFDILMLDEAQDTNMVTLSICSKIKAKHKIFVGDDNQQIYSFRDSVNAMDKLSSPKKFFLTETFRFPLFNSHYANTLLVNYKGSDKILKSNVVMDEKFDLSDKDEDYCVSIQESMTQRCYISRTNSVLIFKMIELMNKGLIFKTIRDPEEIFSLAIDVFYLDNYEKHKIWKNKFLLDFNTIEELEVYANKVDDVELLSAININKKIGSMLLTLKDYSLKYYNEYAFNKKAYKDYLTTAHTCKGMEWDYVSIEDSFPDFIGLIYKSGCTTIEEFRSGIKTTDSKIVDEFNLYYVAMTRSKISMRILDSNKIYLEIGDSDINLLIKEYTKAIQAFENSDSEFFEFDPKAALGLDTNENDFVLEDTNDYNIIGDNEVDNNLPLNNMKKDLMDMGNKNDEKREEFFNYANSLTSWEQTSIKNGNLSINGCEVERKAIVGVRIGNGIRIHPMEIESLNNEIIIMNNTQWRYSDLTVIDLIDNIPLELISKIGSCEKIDTV